MFKKLLALLALFFCVLSIAPGADAQVRMSGAKNALFFYKNDSSSTTVNAVSASDVKTTRLFSFVASVSAADTLEVKCGSVSKAKFYFAANSGLLQNAFPFYIECRPVSAILTGTVSTTSGSATITGSGTNFSSVYGVGDRIVVTTGDTLTISAVGSDTSMTASSNASTTVSGKTHKRGADNLNFIKGAGATVLNVSGWYEQEQ
jgi:hypothetical protein